MGVLKARVGADWVTVSQGGLLLPGGVAKQILVKNSATDGDASWQDQPHIYYASGPGGNVASGTSPRLVTLTLPALPAGKTILVTATVRLAQTTTNVFDLIYEFPGSSNTHQQGAGALNSGWIHSFTRPWLSNGTALSFGITINNWGTQPVSWDALTNVCALVVPS